MSPRTRNRPRKAARVALLHLDALETRQLLSVGVQAAGPVALLSPVFTSTPNPVATATPAATPGNGSISPTPTHGPTGPTKLPVLDPNKVLFKPLIVLGGRSAPPVTRGVAPFGPVGTVGGTGTLPQGPKAAFAPYGPADIRHAYGVDQLPYDGAGQTIAIVDAYGNPTIQADLKQFDQMFGLPDPPSFTVLTPQGPPPAPVGSWAIETSLDVEWAHAIAPKANIVLVATASNSGADLYAGIDAAVATGAQQVSMSFGAEEFAGINQLDSHFQVPGVSFFASSGDNSAGDGGTNPIVLYPAAVPNVVGVGGTNLQLAGAGNTRSSETVWGNGNLASSGTGGGYSQVESLPGYQQGFVTGKQRGVPDVALVADPSTGVYIIDNYDNYSGAVGGTSDAAPQWAGLAALANQGLSDNGKSPLGLGTTGGTNGVLYGLAGGTSYTNANNDFHDITQGSNGFAATTGWDPATGLGVPNAEILIPDLIGTIDPAAVGVLKDPLFANYVLGAGPTAYRYAPAGTAWTYTGTAGISGNGSAVTSVNPASPAGPQVAFVQDTGSISQRVAGFSAGNFQLSFQAAQRGNYQASRQDFQVLVDTVVVATYTPASTTYQGFTTPLFSVGAGAHTITFKGLDGAGGDNTALIGNVSLGEVTTSAPTLVDGGFAQPALVAGQSVPTPVTSPWTFAGPTGIASNNSAITTGNPNAPDGTQVAYLGDQGTISQAPADWAAGVYQVGFAAAQRGNGQASRQDFRVLVDGQPVGTYTPSTVTYQNFMTTPFVVTAGAHTISFQGLDSAGGRNAVLIDGVNVSLSKDAAATFTAPVVAPVGDTAFAQIPVPAGGFLLDPVGSAWTFVGSTGLASNGSTYTAGNGVAPQSTQVAFLENQGSFAQDVAGFKAGRYLVNFTAAQRGTLQAARQDFAVLIDGVIVSTVSPMDASYKSYWTAPFTVTAGTHTVTFAGLDSAGGDNTALIGGVSVVSAN